MQNETTQSEKRSPIGHKIAGAVFGLLCIVALAVRFGAQIYNSIPRANPDATIPISHLEDAQHPYVTVKLKNDGDAGGVVLKINTSGGNFLTSMSLRMDKGEAREVDVPLPPVDTLPKKYDLNHLRAEVAAD